MTAEVLDRRDLTAPGSAPPAPPAETTDGGEPGGIFGDTARVGLYAFLGTVTMLFLGFTSAFILRRASADWRVLAAPSLIWLSTGALVVSSLALERAKRRLAAFDLVGAETWVWATGALGALFVAAQFGAWRQLSAAGVFLASNPSSSFFYVITGTHILHVASALVWFAVIVARLRRLAILPGGGGLSLFATYWHYLGALWLYLVFLMFGR